MTPRLLDLTGGKALLPCQAAFVAFETDSRHPSLWSAVGILVRVDLVLPF